MNPAPMLPSDRQLLDAARRGDAAAWAELTQRHRRALMAVVGTGRAGQRRLDEVVATARARLVQDAPAPPGDPDLRVVRAAMIAAATDGFYGPRWPGVLSGDGGTTAEAGAAEPPGRPGPPAPPATSDEELLAVAFSTLPEPWQTALWHHDVDGEDVDVVGTFVGRPAAEVNELLTTARRGLVDAFFREYEALGPFDTESARIVPLLAGYHRRSLSAADRDAVDRHLRRDHIAVAPPDDDFWGSSGAVLQAPDAGAAPLPPPSLRHHDAVDSRRLLNLVGSLDRRLAPSIAPGVMMSADRPVPPDATDAADREPGGSRRRVLSIVGALLIVVGVLVGAIVVGGRLGDGDSASSSGSPVTSVAPATTAETPTTAETATTAVPDDTDDEASVPDGTDDAAGLDIDTDDDGDGTDGPQSETSAPPTTVLPPEAEPPTSTISVERTVEMSETGAGRAGLVAADDDVSVDVSSPAPVFAGGTGTFDFTIFNDGPTDATVTLRFLQPRGVRFAGGSGGVCADPLEPPACAVNVAAGTSAVLSPRFVFESAIVGRLVIDGDVRDPLDVPISVTPDLLHSSVGRGDVVVVGNTVTGCAQHAAAALGIDCRAVADGTGEVVDRQDVPVEFVGVLPEYGLVNSSTATLDLPEGARTLHAQLFWAGDREEGDQAVPGVWTTPIAFGLPGGGVRGIEAGRVVLGDDDVSQYLASSDVTELVRRGGSGSYTVGNVPTVEVQGSYGAWALVVVFDDDDQPRRHRVITQPYQWVAPEDPVLGGPFVYEADLPVAVGSDSAVRFDVFGLEGDLGAVPEQLVVGGQVVGGDNAFDSSITGVREPDVVNNLGVDIDTYDLTIDTSDGLLPIRATSENDGFRVAVLGLSVDLDS